MKQISLKSNRIIRVSIRSDLTRVKKPLQTNSFVYPAGVYSTQSSTKDDKNLTDDYHRETEKKKFVKQNLFYKLGLCLLTLILIFVSITLIILLTRSQSNKSNQIKTVVLRWNSSGITVAGNGTQGIASNQFRRPWDLVFDWNNSMYVTDRFNHRVQKFFRGSSIGITVAGNTNGNSGTTLAEFNNPTGIEVDADQNLFITDRDNCRVLFWPVNALSGRRVAGNGICGSSINQLKEPYGLHCDYTPNTFYVADHTNFRVMRYLLNGNGSGTLVVGGNGVGGNTNQLNYCVGLFLNKLTTSLFVTNVLEHSIVRFSIGINNWTLVVGNSNGLAGSSSAAFNSPTDVMLDPMDNIYVADRYNHRIQFFLPFQRNGTTIAGITNRPGSNSTLLNGPTSIQLDNQLNLYVVDQDNHRIQKFLRY